MDTDNRKNPRCHNFVEIERNSTTKRKKKTFVHGNNLKITNTNTGNSTERKNTTSWNFVVTS